MAKILLIENYKSILQMLNSRLLKMDFEVIGASAQEAIACLTTDAFDLILLDPIDMPKDEAAFLEEARGLLYVLPPVLILIAPYYADLSKPLIKGQSVVWVEKPIDTTSLKEIILSAMALPPLESEPAPLPTEEPPELVEEWNALWEQQHLISEKMQQLVALVRRKPASVAPASAQPLGLVVESYEWLTHLERRLEAPLSALHHRTELVLARLEKSEDRTSVALLKEMQTQLSPLLQLVHSLQLVNRAQAIPVLSTIDLNVQLAQWQRKNHRFLQTQKGALQLQKLPIIEADAQLLSLFFDTLLMWLFRQVPQMHLEMFGEATATEWRFVLHTSVGTWDMELVNSPLSAKELFGQDSASLYLSDTIVWHICKNIVLRHRGKIGGQRDAENGNVVYFSIKKPNIL